MTPFRKHYQKVTAQLEAQRAADDSGFGMEQATGSEYELMLLKLAEDRRRLMIEVTETAALAATEAYRRLAADHGWDLVHMAIAWQSTRPFKVVPIIGATTASQLDHLIAGLGRTVPDDLRRAIGRLHKAHPMPY